MLGAIIRSPRFDDYEITGFTDSIELEGLDQEIANILQDVEKEEKEIKSSPNGIESTEASKFSKDELSEIKADLKEVQGIISNPQSNIESAVFDVISKNSLGRIAITMIPIVGAALSTPQIARQLVDMLVAPGGPFDRRFKLILANQEEQFLSREAQKRRSLGLDQVVISQTGFGNANGRLTVNTLNQVKATGTSNIGLNEVAIGLR